MHEKVRSNFWLAVPIIMSKVFTNCVLFLFVPSPAWTRKGPASDLFGIFNVGSHVLVGCRLSVDPGLRALHRQSEAVHDDHGLSVHLPQHEAHHLQVSSGPGVHHHLQQGQSWDLAVLEVVVTVVGFQEESISEYSHLIFKHKTKPVVQQQQPLHISVVKLARHFNHRSFFQQPEFGPAVTGYWQTLKRTIRNSLTLTLSSTASRRGFLAVAFCHICIFHLCFGLPACCWWAPRFSEPCYFLPWSSVWPKGHESMNHLVSI